MTQPPGFPLTFPYDAGKGYTVVCDDSYNPGEYVFTVFSPHNERSASLAYVMENAEIDDVQVPASVLVRLTGLEQLLNANNLY